MTTATANTQELLRTMGVELATATASELSDWQCGPAKKAGVRLWRVDGRGRAVVVRTTGGTKAEAKKAARRAGLQACGAMAGSTDELWLNTLRPEGVARVLVLPALSVEVG